MADNEATLLATEAVRLAQLSADAAKAAAAQAAAPTGYALQFLQATPGILLSLLIIGLIIRHHDKISRLLDGVTGMTLFGVEFKLDATSKLVGAVHGPTAPRATKTFQGDEDIHISPDDNARVLKRATHNHDALNNRSILWIDDRPENNDEESDLLRLYGIKVTPVSSDEKAKDMICGQNSRYDLVLSDMSRNGDNAAGTKLLEYIRRKGNRTPMIFYISDLDVTRPTPAGSSGITNRPDELFHLVIDALERTRPLQ